jgi:hypothetical protein
MIENLEEYLVSKIEELHNLKKGKVEPDYVLYIDLRNEIDKDIKNILNKFYKEKRYKIGKTLNDKYIKNKEWYENETV